MFRQTPETSNPEKQVEASIYAKRHYNISSSLDYAALSNYFEALLSVASADDELGEEELGWLIEEQRMLLITSEQVFDNLAELIKTFDWKNIDLNTVLDDIRENFPMTTKRILLYQAIKMSQADKVYHQKERATTWEIAKTIGLSSDVVRAIENLVSVENHMDRLRHALLGTSKELGSKPPVP